MHKAFDIHARSGEGQHPKGCDVGSLTKCKGQLLIPRLEFVTYRSQGDNFTVAPWLPFLLYQNYPTKNIQNSSNPINSFNILDMGYLSPVKFKIRHILIFKDSIDESLCKRQYGRLLSFSQQYNSNSLRLGITEQTTSGFKSVHSSHSEQYENLNFFSFGNDAMVPGNPKNSFPTCFSSSLLPKEFQEMVTYLKVAESCS